MLPIPLAPSDVTPDWLTTVLRQGELRAHGLDGVMVVSVAPMQSLTSTMHRLRIEYAQAGPAYPRTLIWKQSSTDPAIRAALGHFLGSGYEREVRFYREVAPRIGARVPRCFLAQYDEATDEHVLLLEDLGPARCVSSRYCTAWSGACRNPPPRRVSTPRASSSARRSMRAGHS